MRRRDNLLCSCGSHDELNCGGTGSGVYRVLCKELPVVLLKAAMCVCFLRKMEQIEVRLTILESTSGIAPPFGLLFLRSPPNNTNSR